MNLQKAMLVPAFASIAIAVATVAIADPHSDSSSADHASAPDLHGTVTVTATIAPGQCQPVAGGPTITEAADTGQEPDSSTSAAAQPVEAASSRFDPYTCAPVPADASGTQRPTETGSRSGSTGGGHDSYTPTLQPFPNSGGGAGVGPARGPLSDPTTTAMLPGPPTPTAPYHR